MRKRIVRFLTRSYTNRPVQSQKKARSLKFKKKRDCTICVAKTKALISCAVTDEAYYTPSIYADGYIVFAFPFVCSLVRWFVGSLVQLKCQSFG